MTSASTSSEVLIVGGGIMGSAVGLRLAQRGVKVTVVERGIPGAEASSAAAGMVAPQTEADSPGPMLSLGLRSRALYPALAVELREATGIDIVLHIQILLENTAVKMMMPIFRAIAPLRCK